MPKTTSPKVAKAAKAKDTPAFTATINILGKKYTAEGTTVREAISNLNPGSSVKTRAILTVSSEKKTKDRVLTPFAVARLFSLSPLTREFALKNTALLFDV